MGDRYTVIVWKRLVADGEYLNVTAYSGASILRAILTLVKAKRSSGCVRLEWRG